MSVAGRTRPASATARESEKATDRRSRLWPLEPGVLGFQFPQTPHLVDLHAAIASAPAIEGLFAHSVATAYLSRGRSLGVGLLEDADDLGLGESRLLHVPGSPFPFVETLTLQTVLISGAGPGRKHDNGGGASTQLEGGRRGCWQRFPNLTMMGADAYVIDCTRHQAPMPRIRTHYAEDN